ncbi:MAG: TonB-dependent receptor [Proteobacteria bacterium]|nr:TonB-dependent receptor [Pseudomonadota bacterium]
MNPQNCPAPTRGQARGRLTLAFLCIAGLACQAPVGAAETAPADEAGLKEIVVTATRHEESISRVPVSLSAFSQETMDQKGIKDINDVVRFTPGLSIDNTGTNAISIRGISSSGGAGTTGIYIDDTPIQMRALGFNPDDTLPKTFDLERVEVLRGPQGTLFGAGSEGGTVRYLLAQPSLTQDSTYLRSELSYTQYGEASYEAGIAHGGPIKQDVLGYRASVWYRYDGGWMDRVDPTTRDVVDNYANHTGTVVLRLAGIWQPVQGLRISPSIIYQNSKRHDVSNYMPVYSDAERGKFKNADPSQLPVPDKWYLPALKVEADLGPATLISNTSLFHRDEITGYEGTMYNLGFYQSLGWENAGFGLSFLDPGQYPLLDTSGYHLPASIQNYRSPATVINRQESITQELRLQSNSDASRLRWTIGAFFSLSREESIEEIHDPMVDQFFEAIYGVSAQDAFGYPLLANGDSYYNRNVAHDRQYAGFGEATFAFTDQWKLTLGGRIARMSFDLSHFADGLQNFGPDQTNAGQKETAFTPKVGLSFQLNPDNLFYATYAKGFRPGGGNAPLIEQCSSGLIDLGYSDGKAPLQYDSDKTNSYEIGSKNNFNNRLKLASSVYYIKWTGIQQSVYVGTCGLQFTDNLGTAVAKGFDLQAEAKLGGHLDLEAAVGYTNARYTKDSKAGLAITGDAISGEAAIGGSPGAIAPWTASVGVQYNFSGIGEGAYARLDYQYQSRNNWPAVSQDPRSSQYTPYTYSVSANKFASLRAGADFGGWNVSFFIDNLFDSHTTTNYLYSVPDPYFPGDNRPGPMYVDFTFRPRTFGITASYRK